MGYNTVIKNTWDGNSRLGWGLFPPPSQNCPGARGEGNLTEAAGSGGAPAAEAVTVAGTAGRLFQQVT